MSTELNDKIELIKTARNNIKTALYNKTGESQSDDIRTYANKIANINTGINTQDANALNSDILTGKTAYVNNIKLIGSMNNLGDLSIVPNLIGGTINSGYVNSINISAVTSSIDPNITANNIANGVNILGVIGTYEGSDGVKLFDSIINMQNSSGNQEGDLAVVYTSTQANITADTEFQIATFPETVTLTSAISDYIEVSFIPVESTGGMFDCWGSLDSSRFSLDIYGDSGSIRIQYTSQDGLTYTRTTFKKDNVTIEGDEIDFGIVIKFGSRWGEAQWDDRIGQFIITGSSDFEGLFRYEDNSFNYAKTQFGSNPELIYKSTFYGSKGVVIGSLQNVDNLSLSQTLQRAEIYNTLSELTLDSNITNLCGAFLGKPYKYIPNINTSNVTDMGAMFKMCTNLVTVPNFSTTNVTNMIYMFSDCTNLINVPNFDISNSISTYEVFNNCTNLINVPNFNTSNVINMMNMFMNCRNLTSIPAFDTSNAFDIAYMFYNCQNLTSVPSFNMINVTSMNFMFHNCNNLSTSSYVNIANSLPLAKNIRDPHLVFIGLNIDNFSQDSKVILGQKRYVEAIPYIVNVQNVSTTWNIQYS